MADYKVHGETESGVKSILQAESGHLEVKQAVRFAGVSRGEGSEVLLSVEEDDLLEVELEDGFTLWTTIDRLQTDCNAGVEPSRDGNGSDDFPMHYPLSSGDSERGFVANVISGVKVLGYDLPKKGALYVAEKIENQLKDFGQFFRVSVTGDMVREDPPEAGTDKPTLILIHGTASSTASAFAGFFNESVKIWQGIHARYQGRVYAFEHRTLTEGPLENAIEFLQAIPRNSDLHLVTHSRGGLIGDLLAHGQVSGEVFPHEALEIELGSAFGKSPSEYREQLERYKKFNQLIARKAPNVTRYVRVGCPAAGTTLASGRLDVYVSILVNLLGQVPGVGPLLGGLGELAAAVAKERTKPEVIPGLEAQMPKSAFVRLLNGSEHELTTDLTVLAADSDGLWKNLANLFYWRANDLVVDTRSMYGGAPRQQRLWHLEENRHVTHLNYFRRTETAEVVARGLSRIDADTTSFNTDKPKGVARGKIDEGDPRARPELPAVVLLPGIMGSNLAVVKGKKRDRLWLDKSDLMLGRGRRLRVDSDLTIEPAGVFDSPYEKFCEYLGDRDVHVLPMAYDWRLSLQGGVDLLDKLVRDRLDASDQPLHLMAHSMGGAVASLFMKRCPDTWRRLRSGGGRLVQAGTPNLGSYVILRIMRGEEKMIRLIAGLDFKHDLKQWVEWASRFQGALELAPTFNDDVLDFSKVQAWKDLGARAVPKAADLKDAQVVWGELQEQTAKLAGEGVLYVAGGPTPTPIYDPEEKDIRFTDRGDGRVTWDTGIPPDAPTWYIPVKHGSLLDSKGAFAGLRELLLNGSTDQLSTEQPAASSTLRGAPPDTPLFAPQDRPEDEMQYLPSNQELEAAALDMEEPFARSAPDAAPVMPCAVSVVHGDLRFSEHAVVVGHYRGDQIVHAEDILDRQLDGSLRSCYQLRVYPGAIGTSEVFFKRGAGDNAPAVKPKGAIVVGLGNVGELTTTGLARTVESGLLRYANTCLERGQNTSSLKISALLVGSGEAGVGVPQVIEAFLMAVDNVNRALGKMRVGDDNAGTMDGTGSMPLTYISELEFMELYQDMALEALHSLCSLPATSNFSISRQLHKRSGGLHRSRMGLAPAWWTRLRIESELVDQEKDKGAAACNIQRLVFTSYGNRARAPVNKTIVQRRLIDTTLRDVLAGRQGSDGRLPVTLFEQLVPASLKGVATTGSNVQLIVDEGAAAYPWELLTDRRIDYDRPGFGFGVLRQLRIDDPPEVSHPEQNTILVVGDPPSDLVELQGAQREAEEVFTLFNQRVSWNAVPQIRHLQSDMSAYSVMSSLQASDFRILHLAGHGVYEPGCVHKTGMIIGGSGGDDDPFILLNPAEIRKNPMTPELVFINCCHLGRIEGTTLVHELASNLAAQFIRSGVKAVVAAGWPVNDEAARVFCVEFYGQMLDGSDFGTAVSAAREKIYHHESNTWGAYQCYGDPGYRLLMDAGVRSRARGKRFIATDFLDSSELVIEANNLASRLNVQNTAAEKQQVAEELTALVALAERMDWLSEIGVCISLGRVYGELGDFERAVEFHEQAAGIEDGGVTLADLERLANYRSRLGEKTEKISLVNQAIRGLNRIIDEHGETSERLSLRGAAYKRIVQLRNKTAEKLKAGQDKTGKLNNVKDEIRQTLRNMTQDYIKAATLKTPDWYYPATNALLGVILLGGPWKTRPQKGSLPETWDVIDWADQGEFDRILSDILGVLRHRKFADFWDAVAPHDLAVVEALAKGEITKIQLDKLIEGYRETMQRYGSEKEIDSVVNQWKFARETAAILGNKAAVSDLDKLREALQG